MTNINELATRDSRFAPGHRTCAGCTIPPIVRTVMRAVGDRPVVATAATGCLEVTSTIYPESSWEVPYIHSAFENAAATASGIESAYKFLKKKGELPEETEKEPVFLVFGGDGGTYDIGLQSLSGALERGHNLLYICYDNQAYMNTGIQRSSATPHSAWTTTTKCGKAKQGKTEFRKNITEIVAAHNIEYIAQASVAHLQDLANKVEKALEHKGPKFIAVLEACVNGWKIPTDMGFEISRKAVETRFWPLYEIENGEYQITHPVEDPEPIEHFLEPQGRFKHLFKPEKNETAIARIQSEVDKRWEYIEMRNNEMP